MNAMNGYLNLVLVFTSSSSFFKKNVHIHTLDKRNYKYLLLYLENPKEEKKLKLK